MREHTSASQPDPGQLYARAMESTRRYVAGVRADQWTLPTPCTDWNVRDVVNHLVGENLWAGELFQGKTIPEVGDRLDGDLVGDDPLGAYERSMEVARAVVQAPGAMQATCHLSFGPTPGAEYASQLFLDALIHGWDIAKGSGQDTRLDVSLVEACLPQAEAIPDEARTAGAFAAKVPVGSDADPQTRLLALLGRRA